MAVHLQPLTVKIIEFQKEILRLKTELVQLRETRERDMKTLFLEQIAWLEMICLMIDDIQASSSNGEVSTSQKSLERLKNKMTRFLTTRSIMKIAPGPGPLASDDFKIVETRPNPDLQNGTVLEVIREGYKWEGHLLRKSEVVTVRN